MDYFLSLFNLQGRLSRRGWWIAQGISVAALLVYILFLKIFGLGLKAAFTIRAGDPIVVIMTLLTYMVQFSCLWISIASSVRRMHDRGRSGVFCLAIFIPFIGAIWLLVDLGFLPGEKGDNHHGPELVGGRRGVFSEAFAEVSRGREGAKGYQDQAAQALWENRQKYGAASGAKVYSKSGFGVRET